MSLEEVEKIMAEYDRLYAEASKYDHLCQAGSGSCARGTPTCCILQPGMKRAACDLLDPTHGCRGKSLLCKVWFCGYMKDLHPELVSLVERWTKEARALPRIFFFQSREDYQRSLESHFISQGECYDGRS